MGYIEDPPPPTTNAPIQSKPPTKKPTTNAPIQSKPPTKKPTTRAPIQSKPPTKKPTPKPKPPPKCKTNKRCRQKGGRCVPRRNCNKNRFICQTKLCGFNAKNCICRIP